MGDKTVDIRDQKGKIRRATFPQLRKVTPTEALITKIPANLRYGRQAKYLKSSLPKILQEIARQDTVPTPNTSASDTRRVEIANTKGLPPKKRTRVQPIKRAQKTLWKHRLRPRKSVR